MSVVVGHPVSEPDDEGEGVDKKDAFKIWSESPSQNSSTGERMNR
jgi:hypothetical protein